MNKIIFLLVFLFSFNSFTAEYSEVHKVVKDTVIDAYTLEFGENILTIQDYDIWGLQFAENDSENCGLTVTGVSKRPTYYVDFKFWVCVNSDKYGYSAYLIKDEMILD